MKLLSKLPRAMFVWGFSASYPLLLLDAYRHTFTFVTIKDPRVESGITFVACILKFQMSLALYVDRPYEVRSEIMKKWRERMRTKET